MANEKQKEVPSTGAKSPYGQVIILPTLDYPDPNHKAQVYDYLKGLFGEGYTKIKTWYESENPKEKSLMLDENDLKAISVKYEQEHGRPLVHVYSANSPKAALKPSELGAAERQAGQASFYQGWQDTKGREPKDGKLWLNVAGIPTIDAPWGTPGAKDPSDDEIKYYIAQLYFFIAQGKSVCLPVRRVNLGLTQEDNDKQHVKVIRTSEIEFTQDGDKNPHPLTQLPPLYGYSTDGSIIPFYEYAFGGGVAATFKKSHLLEAELNKLNIFVKAINDPSTNLGELLKTIDPQYVWAFNFGRKNQTLEALPNKYREIYQVGEFAKTATMVSENPVWAAMNQEAFTKHFTDQNHLVKSINLSEIEITVRSGKGEKVEKKGTVLLQKDKTGHVQATAVNPTSPEVQTAMVDAMSLALGSRGKVEIIVEPASQAGAEALREQLWSEAMKKGLQVVGYEPADKKSDIYLNGIKAKQAFLDNAKSKREVPVGEVLKKPEVMPQDEELTKNKAFK